MATADSTRVEYRDIPGHPGYRVGDDGSIWSAWQRSGRTGWKISAVWHQLKPMQRNKYGHRVVYLTRDCRRSVHRLVLLAFVGPPADGLECCHNNGDPSDNRLCNLRWGTTKENAEDRGRHGSHARGSTNGFAKLTEPQVVAIRAMRAGGATLETIAKQFAVHLGTIHLITTGKSWRHVA
jgi:hypothetical protein